MILLLLLSFLILFQIYLKPIYTFTYTTAKYQIFNMEHSMKCVTHTMKHCDTFRTCPPQRQSTPLQTTWA